MKEELNENKLSSCETLSWTRGSKKTHPAARCEGHISDMQYAQKQVLRMKHQEKQKHKILDWLKKLNLFCFDFVNDCYFMSLF